LKENHHWIRRGSLRLAAIMHEAGSNDVIVMAHGFTGHKSEAGWLFTKTARLFASRGFNVLRFDFSGSGDSEGDFSEMSPLTEMEDLNAVIDWTYQNGADHVGLLGLSLGGAVSILTAAKRKDITALAAWSPVPDLKVWAMTSLPPQAWECALQRKAYQHGPFLLQPSFLLDMIGLDVSAAYASLLIPKLIVEGTKDHNGFQAGNLLNHMRAPEPKHLHLIDGADHVFNDPSHRQNAMDVTLDFFKTCIPD
jgi:uncharacterized protein